jgi:hypothetical protein
MGGVLFCEHETIHKHAATRRHSGRTSRHRTSRNPTRVGVLVDNCEAYYSQVCYTCGEDKSLIHYSNAELDRTCRACFTLWMAPTMPLRAATRIIALQRIRAYATLQAEVAR